MEHIESLSVTYDSANSRKEQRDFLASILLDAVNESLGEDGRLKEIKWDRVDNARRYLMKNPIAHLYFILLDINIDAALGRLQKKWAVMDREYRRPDRHEIEPAKQRLRVLH